jgi:hypothetical protein
MLLGDLVAALPGAVLRWSLSPPSYLLHIMHIKMSSGENNRAAAEAVYRLHCACRVGVVTARDAYIGNRNLSRD